MSDKTIIRLSVSPAGFGETADELAEDMFSSAVPTQHTYSYYEDEALGLFIGVWDSTEMTEVAGPYFAEEFMWLIEGQVEVKNCKTGEVEIARAGEAFIIPRGYDCQWHQDDYVLKFYVISEHPQEAIPDQPSREGIIILPTDETLSAMTVAAPFQVTAGAAAQEQLCYQDSTGKYLSGLWASEAFESAARPFPYNEFAYVKAGSITLTDAQGVEHVFNEGDTFFVPQGVVCSATVTAKVSVYFAILRAA